MPSVSILAEPTVALVDKNADKHGTRAAAEEYLQRFSHRRSSSWHDFAGNTDGRNSVLDTPDSGKGQLVERPDPLCSSALGNCRAMRRGSLSGAGIAASRAISPPMEIPTISKSPVESGNRLRIERIAKAAADSKRK